MKWLGTWVIGALVFSGGSICLAREPLELDRGTKTAGGAATLEFSAIMPEEGEDLTGFLLNVAPTVGYFLIDRLALLGALQVIVAFGDHRSSLPKQVGFEVGPRYYFPATTLVPYAGVSLGLGCSIPDEGDTGKHLTVAGSAGMLIAMNAHVGIDVGTRIQYSVSLGSGVSVGQLTIPAGYLGVQAFF